jgi:hypothetical protein
LSIVSEVGQEAVLSKITAAADPYSPIDRSAVGLWQRISIMLEDGTADTTSQVYWAQTSGIFVDLRLPAARTNCGVEELSGLSPAGLAALGEQKGFAGRTLCHDNVFIWFRSIDFRPPSGRLDTGLVRIEGDMLFEEGAPGSALGVGYREVYRRIAGGESRCLALELVASTGQAAGLLESGDALLVVLDGLFMFARKRKHDLPASETLTELLVAARGRQSELEALLDCHIALGHVESGRDRWTIDLSTHPWTEGKPLFTAKTAELSGSRLRLDHGPGESLWEVRDSNLDGAALVSLFQRPSK